MDRVIRLQADSFGIAKPFLLASLSPSPQLTPPMTRAFSLLILAAATSCGTLTAQSPGSKIPLSKEIQVVPFTREHKNTLFKPNDREMPDELRVTTTGQVRITGKKKVSPCPQVRGKPACHNGKLALIPVGDRSGKLSVKQPSANDLLYHFACVQLPGDALDTKEIDLKTGVEYTWDVKTAGDSITFTVRDKANVLAALTAPKNQFLAFGIAATVRYKGNEADLTMTFD
jgi:hypothetical protein